MHWNKIGRIFDPTLLREFGLNAALMPIVDIIDETKSLIRVYFSPRDRESRSQVRFFEIDLNDPSKILKISKYPLLSPGNLGTFDDCGITIGSVTNSPLGKYLYYTGWSRTATVPYCNSIGIAKVNKNGSLKKMFDGPVMTRTTHEPHSCASPFVIYDNNKFRMWYASMDRWDSNHESQPRHFYNLKYAESTDGIEWKREGIVAIDYEHSDEYAFGRPFVLKEYGIYKMWYCYRGPYYKIGYAESSNGLTWTRKDNSELGMDRSYEGWDEEMVAYPLVFDLKNTRYMLYNGNGYGKSGIGIAKLVP